MLNKIRKLREKKGFTLVELIVVIAIIAILTAVLVPLIGNWTQQAAYTTLQDAAQTISNSVNEAMSKVTMGGAPASLTSIAVTKSGTTFSVYTNGGATAETIPATLTGSEDTKVKIAFEVKNMLEATMPNTSGFYASISNGAVTGIVYRNDKADFSEISGAGKKVTTVASFNDAYQVGTIPVGASGKYKGNDIEVK